MLTGNSLGVDAPRDSWRAWPVYWSAVWVGALAALGLALVFGLIGIAVGAHVLGPGGRIYDLRGEHGIKLAAMALSVVGAFLAFALGGWVAGKIAGILRSEPAMLHGAIVWLVAVPFLLFFASMGAGSFFGGWYGGLAGTPAWAATTPAPEQPAPLAANATAEQRAAHEAAVRNWEQNNPERVGRATRNAALTALTALLLGLIGSVIGGWMASGEPMTFTHYRTRNLASTPAPATVESRSLGQEVVIHR